jgi:hypothetical protein
VKRCALPLTGSRNAFPQSQSGTTGTHETVLYHFRVCTLKYPKNSGNLKFYQNPIYQGLQCEMRVLLVGYEITDFIGWRLHTLKRGARARSPFALGQARRDTPNAHSLLSPGPVIIRDQRQFLTFTARLFIADLVKISLYSLRMPCLSQCLNQCRCV